MKQSFCYTHFEISGEEHLKRNLTYLLASDLFTADIKYIIVGNVFKDINNFYENIWFNSEVNNEDKFRAFQTYKGDNWSYSGWTDDFPYNDENLPSP